MGDLLVSFDFVCYIKKGKHERTLCTNLDAFPLAGLGRCSSLVVLVVSVKSGPFSVRWRKKVTAKIGYFFASEKAPNKNKEDIKNLAKFKEPI